MSESTIIYYAILIFLAGLCIGAIVCALIIKLLNDAKYVEEEIEITDGPRESLVTRGARSISTDFKKYGKEGLSINFPTGEVTDGKAMYSVAHPGWDRE